jgi:hypothetical protein
MQCISQMAPNYANSQNQTSKIDIKLQLSVFLWMFFVNFFLFLRNRLVRIHKTAFSQKSRWHVGWVKRPHSCNARQKFSHEMRICRQMNALHEFDLWVHLAWIMSAHKHFNVISQLVFIASANEAVWLLLADHLHVFFLRAKF